MVIINDIRMKHIFVLVFGFTITIVVNAQSYDADRVAFVNFLTRMYNDTPFEGVRAVNDYDKAYLIVALCLNKGKYKSATVLNRVASVKAIAEASRFFNGSSITQDLVIHTTDKVDGTSDTEIIEKINEHSIGYVNALEQLTNFASKEEGKQVFLFVKKLE